MGNPGSAEWFMSVLNALDEFVIVKGERSRMLWANRAFCDFYGMDNETLASLVDAEHSDPDDTLQYVRDDHEVWTSGKALTVIEPATRHDGDVQYFETVKRAVRENGETVLTVGISRPATDGDAETSASERSERKLSSDALRSFVTAFPGAVVVVDVKHRVVAASRKFVSLLSDDDNIRGRGLETLLPMEISVLNQVLEGVSSGSELSLKDIAVLADERRFDLDVAPWHLSGGQSLGTMIRLNEVTELRATERRLSTERKALQSVMEVMNVGVATMDERGDIGLWNAAAARMTGITTADARQAYPARDRKGAQIPNRELPLARAFKGESIESEVLMIRDDQTEAEQWITVSASPVEDVPGHAAVAVFTDITDRIHVERELEEFAYVASHDLQEPLRMVKSYVDLLGQEYGDQLEGDGTQYMRFVSDGANRMQNLVRDLLVFSQARKRELVLAPIDLAISLEAVRNHLSSRIAEVGGELTIDEMPTVTGDEAQLTRLFENLLTNALKFSRPGVAPKVRVRARKDSESWIFEVEDNGIGIDPAYADKIFKMFHRLNPVGTYPGTGIGLAICRRVVARHGGSMGLGQKDGEGSLFWFSLPIAQVAASGARELW